MDLRVAVVIPAHNEETTLPPAIRDILDQTYAVDCIVVVNDCSTDGTGEVLAALQADLPRLVVVRNDEPLLRAGAINRGLDYLRDKPVDLVMAADADSRFDPGLVAAAVKMFRRYPDLGGVCTTSGVVDLEKRRGPLLRRLEAGLLWRLQRLEGAGNDAIRTASWRDVQILHGLCTVFDFQALISVGGYTSGHMLEDYELTLRLKRAGWRAMYCPEMKAWTRVPTSFKAFFRQRVRWMRGGFDIILQYGCNRYTWEDILQHVLFITLFIGICVYAAISIARGDWHLRFAPHPLSLALAGIGYAWSLYRLRFLERPDPWDVFVRAAILPELLVAVALSVLQFGAYYLSVFRRAQKW